MSESDSSRIPPGSKEPTNRPFAKRLEAMRKKSHDGPAAKPAAAAPSTAPGSSTSARKPKGGA